MTRRRYVDVNYLCPENPRRNRAETVDEKCNDNDNHVRCFVRSSVPAAGKTFEKHLGNQRGRIVKEDRLRPRAFSGRK